MSGAHQFRKVLYCITLAGWFLLVEAGQDFTIPPVIISPSQGQQDSLTAASKTIITRQEIETTGVTSLAQALQTLGGVQLQDQASNSSQVLLSMRGFGSNASSNTLLLVNGIPLTNPDLAPPDLNFIPLHEIKYVEIISGSESVLYGDQAVGGIINIVTQPSPQDKGEVGCAQGSYHQQNCYGVFHTRFKQLDLGAGLTSSHTDNYRSHNNYDQTLVSGRADYIYSTGKLNFNYHITNERMQYPGALTALQVAQNRRQSANNTDFFKDWNGFYHIKFQQQLSSLWSLETTLFRRELHGNGVLTLPFTQSRLIHYVRPQITGALGHTILTTGMDVEEDRYHLANLWSTTQDTQQKYGIFGLLRFPLSSKISLSTGVRGAEQKNYLHSFSTLTAFNRAAASTLGITFEYSPVIRFYLRRAESFRFPKADENASTAVGVNGLKTQRGISYEAGMTFEGKKSLSHLSLYQLNLKDEIAFDPMQTPLQPFGVNKNLDPTVRLGFSFSEKYLLTDKISLGGQYNYVNAHFNQGVNAGNRIPLVAENIFHGGANIKITPNWTLYAETLFTGNEYADSDDANVGGKIGGYTLYNLNLRYSYRQLTASFHINNVFNKYYYFYTVYVPNLGSEFFYPAPGRSFLFTIKYAFV